MPPSGRQFKVKLVSGRVLGPLDLERVGKLIQKKHIVGTELARVYPQGDWVDINQIEEIAAILLKFAQGSKVESLSPLEDPGVDPAALRTTILAAPTSLLPGAEKAAAPIRLGAIPEKPVAKKVKEPSAPASPPESAPEIPDLKEEFKEEFEEVPEMDLPDATPPPPPTRIKSFIAKFLFGRSRESLSESMPEILEDAQPENPTPEPSEPEDQSLSLVRKTEKPSLSSPMPRTPISEAPTVVFQRNSNNKRPSHQLKMSRWDQVRGTLIAIALGVLAYQFFLEDPNSNAVRWVPVRPMMPQFQQKSDPQKSASLYAEAMKVYLLDTVPGYRRAAEKLTLSAALDSGNVRALAMLASSYLNLIDASNKDEKYFQVISKLIEMSRAKNLDLPETVISDVEYYIFANKAEAAQNRIVEYTKTHQAFGREMFYYISLAFFYRGDFQSSARYLSQIADNQAFSAKVFYLRGMLAEKFEQPQDAILEYEKAIRLTPSHARSRLRIAAIRNSKGQLKDSATHLEYLVSNPFLLAPKEMAKAYYLHSVLSQVQQKWDIALGDMERATALDGDDHDYLLELYTLRAKAGDKDPKMKAIGRMYYFLSEGEKLLRGGKTHEALTQFLSAKQASPRSALPHVKIGDMFSRLHKLQDARINYKLAADRSPNSIEIWSKYIDVLIKSFEWEEAKRAMDKFRQLQVPQSAIDKAAADMYAKQGSFPEALKYYQKAMSREVIDPSVYLAYAQTLMAVKNYKDAPFFFAFALRFDPLNSDALIGTAKCIAATESIERAINLLQDELQKDSSPKAQILAAIAEFQMQKGDWVSAQQNVEQAIATDPDYAYPWKLQAEIHLNKEGSTRGTLERALEAYKSYSERNASDPSGYLERYKLFIKKTEFEKAGEELEKIFAIYPKYPNIHYYKGALYTVMRNHKMAIEEYLAELKNNPNSTTALKGLAKEYVDAGNPNEGIKHLTRAMEINPQDAEAKADAGYANYLLKNYAGAIGLYRAALVYDPANSTLYKRLGLAYRESGDYAQAAQSFRKYIQMEPDAPDRAEFERFR